MSDGSLPARRVAGLSSYLDQTATSMTLFAPTNAALAAAGLDVRIRLDPGNVSTGSSFRKLGVNWNLLALASCL